MSSPEFSVIFRNPVFPVVGFADGKLFSAMDLESLVLILISFDQSVDDIVKLADSKGEEFWYSRKQNGLGPGFAGKRWTKRQIIELYNNHVENDRLYPVRSLSNKRLSEIIAEVSILIRSL